MYNNQIKSDNFNYKVVFETPDSIKFPKSCICCGRTTDLYKTKFFHGNFHESKDYKKNYKINVPLCLNCQKKVKIKKGYKNFRIWTAFILLIISSISMIFLILNTYAFLLGIVVIILSFLVPFYFFRKNIKQRIKLSDIIQIDFVSNKKDLITIFMNNKSYINYLENLNQESNEENQST
jgi:hypothetical protein